VSGSYPDSSSRDDEITGLDEAVETGAIVFHAGTAVNKKGAFTTNKSGRVLDVVGVGASLEEARRIAYAGAEKISFSGMRHRSDIGAEASQSS
jgi:phosphoribosylamine--glycine ligase